MLNKLTRSTTTPFQAAFWPSVIIGSVLATVFYGLLRVPILAHPLLIRYALCHFVAVVSVYMFLISVSSLVHKAILVRQQRRLSSLATQALDSLVETAPDGPVLEKADWLSTLWKAQPTEICHSWFGRRVAELLSRQSKRGNCKMLEDDLKDLADRDADHQHESYGLVRIMTWAMPMLGFLGTVIGISDTLGQMDTTSLASGSQEAMDNLTAGLYVAFDTTAVGLVLTMATMFAMFGIGRIEVSLLQLIDSGSADHLHELLKQADEEKPQDVYHIESTVRLVSEQFLTAVERIVVKQAELWKESIAEAQSQWTTLTSSSSSTVSLALTNALDTSLSNHTKQLEKIQLDGASQIDARYQQWQTTLSEQSRTLHTHHGELVRQTQLLEQLIDKGEALRKVEDGLQQNLARLTDIDRFHEAAICLTEAVAVLGTQMERAGYIGRQRLRRVIAETQESHAESQQRRKAA